MCMKGHAQVRLFCTVGLDKVVRHRLVRSADKSQLHKLQMREPTENIRSSWEI